jgi:hypothetical protein
MIGVLPRHEKVNARIVLGFGFGFGHRPFATALSLTHVKLSRDIVLAGATHV